MKARARSVDWVVFDLGETLVDETANWRRWADHLGIPHLTFFATLGAVIAQRRPHTDVFEVLRPGLDLTAEDERRTAAGNGWGFTEADLYDDALTCLVALRKRGYSLAVMANQPLVAAPFMASLPVDRVAASAEWGLTKPDPRFFDRVAAEVGAAPDRIACVGDRVDNDVLPAKAAGMLAVHVRRGPWGVLHAGWPEAAHADLRLDNLTELADRLEQR